MPDPLHDELSRLDRGIADGWKSRAKGNSKHKMTGPDVDIVVWPALLKKKRITENQARAILRLLDAVEWTDQALANLRAYVKAADKGGFLEAGATPLTSVDELKPFNNALGMAVISKIIFKSPKTGISYEPRSYLAVQQLVAQRKISVFEIRIGGLAVIGGLTPSASYRSDINRLYVFSGIAPAERAALFVHEVTHAIQDWRNLRAAVRYAEADAYIAGSIAERALSGAPKAGLDDIHAKADAAALLVIEGKAAATSQQWLKAYDAVEAAVSTSVDYANEKDLPFDNPADIDPDVPGMDALLAEIDRQQGNGREVRLTDGRVVSPNLRAHGSFPVPIGK